MPTKKELEAVRLVREVLMDPKVRRKLMKEMGGRGLKEPYRGRFNPKSPDYVEGLDPYTGFCSRAEPRVRVQPLHIVWTLGVEPAPVRLLQTTPAHLLHQLASDLRVHQDLTDQTDGLKFFLGRHLPPPRLLLPLIRKVVGRAVLLTVGGVGVLVLAIP